MKIEQLFRNVFMLFAVLAFSCDVFGKIEISQGNKDSYPVIFAGGDPSSVESHAASELSKYIKATLGTDCKILHSMENVNATNVVLLGNSGSNTEIKKLEQQGLLKLSKDFPGNDSFIIRTLSFNGKNYLVLGGSSPRASLYAVYHFCENFLGTGFFWEGDRIYPQKSLVIKDINIVEQPFFNMRVYMQECPFVYSTVFWDINDWIKELDWMSKKKLNTIMLPTDIWNYCVTMSEIAKEAKKRGITLILGGECTRFDTVTEDFMKKNPNHKYIKMRWWEDAPYYCIHPADPLFIERGKETIRKLVNEYGYGNIYFYSPYGEQTIMDVSDDEIMNIRMAFGESIQKIINAEDPEGSWMYWTWPFIGPVWPKEHVKKFVETMSDKNAFVCDSSQPEMKGDYHYKRFEYFYGKKWLLSLIHLYGGDDYMAGNLAGLIKDIKTVVKDPSAKNCRGIYICPELIHYNTIYFDLLSKLSWNPASVELDDFVKKYLLERYGRESYSNMNLSMDFLLKSVYGEKPSADGQYQHRPFSGSDSKILDLLLIAKQICRENNLEDLRKSLEYALKEKENQKNNPLYQRDIVDLTRQYISDIFNFYYLKMPSRRDSTQIRNDVETMRFLLDKLQELLAAYPRYQIKPLLEKRKGIKRFDKISHVAKDAMLTFASKEWLIDYSSKDIAELLKYYYRPRIEIYFNSLLKGEKGKDLSKGFRKVEESWLKMDILSLPETDYVSCGNIADKASRIFNEVNNRCEAAFSTAAGKQDENDFLYCADKPLAMKSVAWEANFSGPAQWKRVFFNNGKMTQSDGIIKIEAENNEGTVFETSVNIPVTEYPLLSFKMKTSGHQTVIWMEWIDSTGIKRRNRVWQEPPPVDWKEVTINLEKVLGVIAIPSRITKIQIENVANSWSCWQFMRIGSLKEASGPVAFYPLDKGNGNIAQDASGKSNDGKIISCSWLTDKSENSLDFNGKTSFVNIPNKDYLNFTDKFSITAWIYSRNPLGARGIVSKGRGNYCGYNFSVVNGKLNLDCYLQIKKGKFQERFFTEEVIEKNKWYNVGIVFDSSSNNVSFYLDGKLQCSRKVSGEICYTPPMGDFKYDELPLTISGISTFPQIHYQFDGVIRNVKLYNRVVTPTEIAREYADNQDICKISPMSQEQKTLQSKGIPVRFNISDAGNNEPVSCKVLLCNEKKEHIAPPDSFSYGDKKNMQFYAFNGFEIKLLPGKYKAVFLKGFEYEPETIDFDISEKKGKSDFNIKLKRWVNLAAMGWYCGDEELQTEGHTEKPYDLLLTGKNIDNAYKIFQAEGLNWFNIVSSVPEKEKYLDAETLTGGGREVNSRMIGDIIFLNTQITAAGLFVQLKAFDEGREKKSAATFAEEFSPIAPVLREGCRGLPTAVALGKCSLWRHAFDEQDPIGYRLLNLGFRMSATAGSDMYINNPATIVKPGFYRGYVKLSNLSWHEIINAYNRQDIFVSYGPYVFMNVNGIGHGSIVKVPENEKSLEISINAGHFYGIKKLQLIKNGKVIKEIIPDEIKKQVTEKFTITVDSTCWLAVKCIGVQGEFFGNWAHTAPVYIQVGERPMMPGKENIEYFTKWLEELKKSIKGLAAQEHWKPDFYSDYLSDVDKAINIFTDLKKNHRSWR